MKLAAFPKCFMDALCIDRTMSVFDWISLAERELKPAGVTGLELYPGFLTSYRPDYLQRVHTAINNAGFEMPMFCASPDFTSPDPEYRASEVAKERQMMQITADLGGKTCRVLSGQRHPEVGHKEGVQRVVQCITALLPEAEKLGITLTMENHFKDNYWSFPEFAQRMELFVEIVNQIPSPWFGVNFDPSNTLLANEDPMALLELVKHRVVTMHASDRRPRPGLQASIAEITDYTQLIHGEIGTGIIDYPAIFTILQQVGFDGWVSIEDGVNGIEELQRSAIYLAKLMNL